MHLLILLRLIIVYGTGIFAYLNYLTPKTRREIIETLIKGLQRLEYRGYDSAGNTSCSTIYLYFKPFSTTEKILSKCVAFTRNWRGHLRFDWHELD